MISIIIPIFNEENNNLFKEALNRYTKLDEVEIICIDGGSSDKTLEIIAQYNIHLLALPNSSRAERLNLGITNAQGNWVLLHHPRSILETNAIIALNSLEHHHLWGAFLHRFDNPHIFYRWTSFYSNYIRLKFKHIAYLDHCIFISKNAIKKDENTVPNLRIFEDTALSLKLRKKGRPKTLPFYSTTSSIRFKKNGMLKQSFINLIMKIRFSFKSDHFFMDQTYEKDLNLNSKYDK